MYLDIEPICLCLSSLIWTSRMRARSQHHPTDPTNRGRRQRRQPLNSHPDLWSEDGCLPWRDHLNLFTAALHWSRLSADCNLFSAVQICRHHFFHNTNRFSNRFSVDTHSLALFFFSLRYSFFPVCHFLGSEIIDPQVCPLFSSFTNKQISHMSNTKWHEMKMFSPFPPPRSPASAADPWFFFTIFKLQKGRTQRKNTWKILPLSPSPDSRLSGRLLFFNIVLNFATEGH